MGISDVLYEASEDIRVYMRERPSAYALCKPRLDKLLSDMDAVRVELDTPPDSTPRKT